MPERNGSPFVTSIVLVGLSLLLVLAAGTAFGLSPYAQGTVAATLLMAGVVLGGWASQASTSWSRGGYVWRFGIAWMVVIVVGFVCGTLSARSPVRS